MRSSASRLAAALKKSKKTLSIAESCTGGLVSSLVTDVPGSSEYFKGGLVAYSNAAKTCLLGVPAGLLKKRGAVSREVARAMAEGARGIFRTDIALSVTGIAGPSGASARKPAGLVYIGIATAKRTIARRFIFKGTRETIRKQAAETALRMLEETV